jgi:predicted dehydrogenase
MDNYEPYNPINAALIGYGYWGRIFEKYLCASEKFKLLSVYSPHLKCDGIYTNNINRVYDNKELESVFICSPIQTHFEYCNEFLSRKKHVFCEKPTVEHLNEFDLLSNLAVKNHRVLLTDYIYTVSNSINMLRTLLDGIGQVLGVSCRIYQYGKFYQNESAYSVVGSHMIAAIMHILNQYPTGVIHSDIIKDFCGSLTLEFPQGIRVNIDCNLLSPDRERKIIINGKKGILIFDMYGKYTVKKYTIAGNSISISEQYNFDELNNINLMLDWFFDLIKFGNYQSNIELSRHVIKILEEAK